MDAIRAQFYQYAKANDLVVAMYGKIHLWRVTFSSYPAKAQPICKAKSKLYSGLRTRGLLFLGEDEVCKNCLRLIQKAEVK